MTGILNLITQRLATIDLTQPLAMFDVLLAMAIVIGILIYISKYPVFRVVLGTLFLFLCSVVFFWAGLVVTALVFGIISNLVLISLPLIFAPEIRHYLEKIGRFSFLKFPKITERQKREQFSTLLVDAVYELAERHVGATIVIERRTGLGETIETGVVLNAKFSTKLLANLFFNKSPLHDGAVIIRKDRIYAAGCLLPLHSEVKLDPPFGTRHKSGLSITKDTDAVVLLVSEQRGEISLAENGKLHAALNRVELIRRLKSLI